MANGAGYNCAGGSMSECVCAYMGVCGRYMAEHPNNKVRPDTGVSDSAHGGAAHHFSAPACSIYGEIGHVQLVRAQRARNWQGSDDLASKTGTI